MNLYETVKGRVTPQMAAERYGLPVNRGGMACCPFHDDRMLAVRESVLRQFGNVLDDATIERVLRHGKADIADRYLTAIRETAAEYVSGIFRRLREHEYDPELMKLHVVGGGSCLVKNFGNYEKGCVIFNDDICATTKGYELLAERRMRKAGGIV